MGNFCHVWNKKKVLHWPRWRHEISLKLPREPFTLNLPLWPPLIDERNCKAERRRMWFFLQTICISQPQRAKIENLHRNIVELSKHFTSGRLSQGRAVRQINLPSSKSFQDIHVSIQTRVSECNEHKPAF